MYFHLLVSDYQVLCPDISRVSVFAFPFNRHDFSGDWQGQRYKTICPEYFFFFFFQEDQQGRISALYSRRSEQWDTVRTSEKCAQIINCRKWKYSVVIGRQSTAVLVVFSDNGSQW